MINLDMNENKCAEPILLGSKDKSSRNDLAKMHHDLVDFSSLTDEEKRKDSKVGTN